MKKYRGLSLEKGYIWEKFLVKRIISWKKFLLKRVISGNFFYNK